MTEGTPPAQDGVLGDRSLDEGAIRAQLARILDSDRFDASDRNRRFLRYVVEECLAGRSQQIKAYCIAVSVFNREPSFDPQSDPIVRLEAGRLRRSLEHYYLTAGRNDPIRIVIPKGGYAPRFEPTGLDPEEEPAPLTAQSQSAAHPVAQSATKPAAQPAAVESPPRRGAARRPMLAAGMAAFVALGAGGILYGFATASDGGPENALALASAKPSMLGRGPAAIPRPHGVGIVLSPFRTVGTPAEAAALASVLTDEVVRTLANQTELPVRLEPARLEPSPASPPAVAGVSQDLRLAGSLQERDGHARVVVHLTDEATGMVLWSEQFDQPLPGGASSIAQDLAAAITAPLTDPQGPLIQAASARLRAKPVATLTPRECAFLATERRNHPPEERAALDHCLEKGASDRTLSANEAARLWSALSYLYADQHRLESAGIADPNANGDQAQSRAQDRALDRALAAASRATELAPTALRPLTALYTAYCLRRQYDLCFAAGDKALKVAPDDPKVLGDLGLWHVEAGDPARGMALMDHAMERDPAQAGRLLPAYGLARQRLGEPSRTLRGDVTSAATAQAALAVAFVQLGRIDEAREAATRALAADPEFAERSAREQRNRPLPPDLDATIRSSFAVVGLSR